MAGFEPAGVIVEILNEDGTMARLPQLIKIAQKFNLKLISIEDLIEYRIKTETSIEKIIDVKMPTKHGDFEMVLYKNTNTDEEHLALVKGTWKENEPVLVRVHSSCMTRTESI